MKFNVQSINHVQKLTKSSVSNVVTYVGNHFTNYVCRHIAV